MDRTTELGIVRRAYAKQIMAAARVDDLRIEAAFAAVLRENFLGPGPWPIFRWLQSDRKSTRLNSSHTVISYAVFCLKKKKKKKSQNSTITRMIKCCEQIKIYSESLW